MISRCLERAIGSLQADAEIDEPDRDIVVDRDTLDVPGSPPIMETIFGKIDAASVFLSDLTYVGERSGGDRTPNPNVCIEHGWALKSLSWRRVIAVMNVAMGDPEQHALPFDVRHTRRPILYNCPTDADADARRAAKEFLTKGLIVALKAIFGDQAARASMRPVPLEPHPNDVALLERARRQLPAGLRHFLRQHDFGQSFHRSKLDPIFEMADSWLGAAYEFHDATLQASFADLAGNIREFAALLAQRTHAVRGSPLLATARTDLDLTRGLQPETQLVIRDLNAKANEVIAAIDSFERVALGRVRIASDAHAEGAKPAGPDPRDDQAKAALEALAFDTIRGGVPEIVTQPRLTLRLVPYAALEGRRIEPSLVSKLQSRFPPNAHDRVSVDSDERQWWTAAMPRSVGQGMNPETPWCMRLVRPGFLEYQASIGTRIDDDREILVEGRGLEKEIVRNLERMASIASELALHGPALVSVSLLGIEDVELSRSRAGGRPIRKRELVFQPVKLDDLAKPLAMALHDQLDMLWQSSGWTDGSPSFASGEWDGYKG